MGTVFFILGEQKSNKASAGSQVTDKKHIYSVESFFKSVALNQRRQQSDAGSQRPRCDCVRE